jgi:hypothetical protein
MIPIPAAKQYYTSVAITVWPLRGAADSFTNYRGEAISLCTQRRGHGTKKMTDSSITFSLPRRQNRRNKRIIITRMGQLRVTHIFFAQRYLGEGQEEGTEEVRKRRLVGGMRDRVA